MMKVLIETIKNRKGYKIFETKDEMNAYLGNHCKDIASYEILQEDDTEALNDMLRALAEDCEVIHNKLFYLFRQEEKAKNKKLSLLLVSAAGRAYRLVEDIRNCLS